MTKVLEVNNLGKVYKSNGIEVNALKNINFSVNKGEFIAIMGRSGSGKTTLLNLLATIDHPTKGSIKISGEDIFSKTQKEISNYRGHNLGFIFQDFNLLSTLTLRENIAYALIMKKIKSKEIDILVSEVANSLSIEHLLNKYPHEVSGGERQRCACARAMVKKPRLVLADEPTGALDYISSTEFLKKLKEMNKDYASTIIMVTHDVYSASYADRIIFIKDGQVIETIEKNLMNQEEFFNAIVERL